jgi:predicted AAA+ superfamily ATPase
MLAKKIVGWAKKYPVVALIGPRQSGKSTLCRMVFKNYHWINLEDPQTRALVKADPQGEVLHRGPKVVIDEVQRWPEILSYLQVWVDDPKLKFSCVITGSNHILLMEKVAQSLAGRVMIGKLLPLAREEMSAAKILPASLDKTLFPGGYPRIFNQKLDPGEWLGQYVATYVERDVRDLLQIVDLDAFQKFVGLCAGRVGSLLNLSSLGNDAGITHPTAKAWVSVLKTSFICFTLNPHHRNFSKRLIKTPKLYFYDTGLLCYLLNIRDADMLSRHPMRGAIFENWIIVERIKSAYNHGTEPKFYFWRDVQNHEVDLIEDLGDRLYPSEIKSSRTFLPGHADSLEFFETIQTNKSPPSPPKDRGTIYYGGDETRTWKGFRVRSWRDL